MTCIFCSNRMHWGCIDLVLTLVRICPCRCHA